MRLSGYLLGVLVFVLCMYTLQLCMRDFRRTRGSGTFKPYLFLVGAVLSGAIMLLAIIAVLLIMIGPLH